MKKRLYLIMILIIATTSIFGTNTSLLNGRIIDGNTKHALEYVTISTHRQDSTVVAGATSDENGNFSIDNIPLGKYYLQTSFIGYTDVRLDLNIQTDVLEIPVIEMIEDAEVLSAAIVRERRPLIEQNFDMLIMNVSEAISAQGSNAIELLRRASGVSIDPNGNIKLNGNNVDVWIDGRPSNLSGTDLENILLSTDASTIDKVEIMAHPSAKYDAAGGGGIINLKTKKNFFKGLMDHSLVVMEGCILISIFSLEVEQSILGIGGKD